MTTKQAPWVVRKAQVTRFCNGWSRANGCGRLIQVGEQFYQCKWRSGLATPEICSECGAKLEKCAA